MSKYKYVPVKYQDKLDKICLGCAGPRPNITGMRLKYWGKDAYIIKSGQYAYWVKYSDFIRFSNLDSFD